MDESTHTLVSRVASAEEAARTSSVASSNAPSIAPQACSCGGEATGCTCEKKSSAQSYIYAIGVVRAAFPSDTIKAEFNESIGRFSPPLEIPDDQLIYEVLRRGENLYLAREMCWILQIDSVDAYILKPRTYVELYDLILSIEPVQQGEKKYDVIIGPRGPLASPDMCNGLQLPIVVVNQDYHFTFAEFVTAMSARANVPVPIVQSMFESLLQIADNAGETDEHRALNYLTIRYPGLYTLANTVLTLAPSPAAETPPYTLSQVSAQSASVQGTRRLIDVTFRYTQRITGGVVYWYCRVDVTGQFPFLVSPLTRYYPHP